MQPIIPGEPEAQSGDTHQCGRLSAEACVRSLGHPMALPGIPDDADGVQIANAVKAAGGQANAVYGTLPSRLFPLSLGVGDYLMVLVNCTGQAVPVPYVTGIRHWLAAWSTAGDAYNPWHADNERVDLDGTYYRGPGGSCVIIGWPGPPPPTPAQQGDGMGASFVTPDGQQARFWITADGHIHEMWYAGGAWHGPVDATATWWKGLGLAAGGLSASCAADGTQLVFWTGRDGHQWEAWYAGGAWNGPVPIA